uniref:hypothetical protein n=1 Tax=Rickettsia endosymbiont of Urophora cardui TaxID=3066265 RepID=UPI00313BCC8F
MFLTLNRSKRTQDVIGNMNKKLKQLSHIIKSITLDNGKEFTNHEQLLPKSERKVYFCNPYSPWQKPLIEKINSMVHRVYSKSLALSHQLCKFREPLNSTIKFDHKMSHSFIPIGDRHRPFFGNIINCQI